MVSVSLVVLGIELTIVLLFVLLIYHHYGSFTRNAIAVTILTVFGWFVGFSIVILVPNDIQQYICLEGQAMDDVVNSLDPPECAQSTLLVDPEMILLVWETLYWTSYILTWAVYPIMQSYTVTGEFTVSDRLVSALKQNLLMYGVCAIVVLVLLLVVMIKFSGSLTFDKLKAIAIAAGNMWGLVLVIIFLGIGLVEIPRFLWRKSNRRVMLSHCYFKIAEYRSKIEDARDDLLASYAKLKAAEHGLPPQHEYRQLVIKMVAKAIPDIYAHAQASGPTIETYSGLSALNMEVLSTEHNYRVNKSIYNTHVNDAIDLEDAISSFGSQSRAIQWSRYSPRTHIFASLFNAVEYYFKMYAEERLLQALSVLGWLLCAAIVWSEMVMIYNPNHDSDKIDLSLMSLLVHAIPNSYAKLVVVVALVLYISACIYSTLFSLKLFTYFRLIPNKHTDSNSLLFSAAYLCRLQAPLVWNFLMMVHLAKGTQFGQVMKIDVVPLMGSYYLFFPVIIAPICLFKLFNVWDRALAFVGVSTYFRFSEDFSDTSLEYGKSLLSSERRSRQHQLTSGQLGGDDIEDIPLSVVEAAPPASKPRATHHAGANVEVSDFDEFVKRSSFKGGAVGGYGGKRDEHTIDVASVAPPQTLLPSAPTAGPTSAAARPHHAQPQQHGSGQDGTHTRERTLADSKYAKQFPSINFYRMREQGGGDGW